MTEQPHNAEQSYDPYGGPGARAPHGEQQQTQTWDTQVWNDRSWEDRPRTQHGHSATSETARLPVQGAMPAAEPAPVAEPAGPLTAAQQARAEGRSPIIAPGIRPAALTAALAALLAVAAPFGPYAALLPVLLLQAVTAAGWYRLNGMWPARQGIALAFAGGAAADAGLLLTDRTDAPTVAVAVIGVWCLLVLVLQLRSHSSPDERLYALTAGLASTVLVVLAAGHLAATAFSPDAVVAGAAAVAVTAPARTVPLPPYVSPVVALLAATGAGIAVGGVTSLGTSGALLGLVAGGCALIGLRVASYDYPSRFVHMTAGVALPLAAAAPAVYLLGRALA
ncbi:hypothetical protein M1E25_08035 [Streptomyces sp. MTZ3.1]|uniref:Integral membrane protein n=1 Tax=Streptomyces meridianus TaxID=2938945 RepID=A0ABT0X424_9ACTN|nr:hypothetical protein [Streptomyces meridianus]MCM2577300.1 hypothetical protein [Streptomyces meridianus]